MKKINKVSIVILGIAFIFALAGPITALAATAPTLTNLANFAVLGATTVTNTGPSVLNGDLGLYDGIAITGFFGTTANDGPGVVSAGYAVHQTDATAQLAQTAATNAYNLMAGQSCGGNDLSGQNLGGMTLTPGVYCFAAAAQLTGTLTLNAQGDPNAVWIFQVGTALTIDNSASVVISNGGAGTPGCNVYWQVGSAATIGTSATFIGTVIANSEAVTLNTGATMYGRAISRIAAVTLDTNTITTPTCIAPATLHVVKTVINDNGGTAAAADFTLNVAGTNVSNPSFAGSAGVDITLAAGFYAVTEPIVPAGYSQSVSGDCSGIIASGDTKICTITNNDVQGGAVSSYYAVPVPPLIDVVKVPNPLALPDGPGTVNYTYTLRNIGTVPASNITMVGDTCSPITLISGDTNADAILDLNETWVYTCSTTLSETHTNIVTATGWANGISATDIATATVIVGVPVVPPLIHVTKVPNPLVLSVGGGMIAYTNEVTNPGTVALSNVSLIDDKCGPVKYVSGDTNGNLKLDTNETWTYTCQTGITQTTVNTIVASGEANGLIARDFAMATVVVNAAVPKLPNTGLPPSENNIPWSIIISAGIFAILASFYFLLEKRANPKR
ncbi:MAG: ice-binding family protein [Candidatus Pacebacteria bacterium]|nr:ice-binding family protein [Candidatus Paceibacterota bacterium]